MKNDTDELIKQAKAVVAGMLANGTPKTEVVDRLVRDYQFPRSVALDLANLAEDEPPTGRPIWALVLFPWLIFWWLIFWPFDHMFGRFALYRGIRHAINWTMVALPVLLIVAVVIASARC